MNPDEKLDALLRAARLDTPDTSRAELAFETRFAARLREERSASWLAWGWRLSPFFAALAVASAVWCHTTTGIEPDTETLLDTVRTGGQSSMLAWWPEGEQ
jgi:hypothetical protein